MSQISRPTSGTKQLMMQLLNLFEAGSLGTKFLKKFPNVWSSNYHSSSVSYQVKSICFATIVSSTSFQELPSQLMRCSEQVLLPQFRCHFPLPLSRPRAFSPFLLTFFQQFILRQFGSNIQLVLRRTEIAIFCRA